ncbi:MAG: hypothetical protein L0Y71_11235 [Gemmataceae bacterium]|nr:hypothetical protein [Gemmataceae bacterium]
MINVLGKVLVMIHVALSLLALTWAAAVFLQFVDWGWTTPRLVVSEHVPSELDKRLAAYNEAVKSRDRALPALKKSQEALFDAMDRYAQNHLFYRDELARLEKSPDKLVVKEVAFTDGALELDVRRTGKPVLKEDVPGMDKSYLKELEGLAKRRQEIDKLVAEHRDWTEKARVITAQLNGLDDDGNKTKVGLYELLEHEAQAQARIRFEKAYIQPQWADALKEAQDSTERRERLEQTLERLKTDLGKVTK